MSLARCQLKTFGITRVSDATALDRLGLPVFVSIRPRGQVLSVHAGKGLLAVEARVGALMEAIEHAAAEPGRSPSLATQPWEPLALQGHWSDRFRLVDLAPPLDAKLTPSMRWDCLRVEPLGAGPAVWLPAELVYLPWEPTDGSAPFFGVCGNGLASGNSALEATVHALFELLERDVTALNDARDDSRWLDPADLPEPFGDLAATWAADGIELLLRELPNPFGLPCFAAVLHEPHDNPVDLAGGWGLHARRDIALTRAICEAAQSRIAMIHGGRDDIGGFFGKYRLPAAELAQHTQALLGRLHSRERQVAYAHVSEPDWAASGDLAQVLVALLEALAAQGLRHVYRHVFEVGLQGLSVVRVIVPGLERAERPLQRMGPRLLARVIGRG